MYTIIHSLTLLYILTHFSDSEVIRGTLESIRMHNLPHQLLTASQIRQRFNVFAPEDNDVGVYEDTAGFLVPELCIRAFLTVASHHGAALHFGETVVGNFSSFLTLYCTRYVLTSCPTIFYRMGKSAKDGALSSAYR